MPHVRICAGRAYANCLSPSTATRTERSGYGDRFNPNYLCNWVSKTLKGAGIEKKGTCHLLGHSCATDMMENGADLRSIQSILGHARLDITRIYAEVSLVHLREVYEKSHPAAQVKRT